MAETLAERKLMADIVEGTNAYVQVVDLEYRWLAINRASIDEFERVYGVRPQVGDSILSLLAHRPKNQTGARAIWSRALAGESFTAVVEVGVPGHANCHYELRLNALRDQDGRLVGAYQFGYDVTERIRDEARLANAEERVRHSQRIESIGQLTGGLAHDFNNLLQTVQGNLQLITRVPDDAKRVLQWADNGLKAVRRGADLTSRLLSFAREQKLELRSIVIASLVRGMADMLHRAIGPLVRLELVVNSAEAAVAADATQLEMAILNLAINARDAMPSGGTLTITAQQCSIFASDDLPAGDYVELQVADNGSGMSAEVVAHAFDPFFTTKGVGKGSGLGLSQVYGMARQLGGRVNIYSQLGSGTTVSLLLPATEPPTASPTVAVVDATPRPTRAFDVLVVDDDASVRRFLVDALELLGHRVVEAADGPAALRVLDVFRPDLMVVDFAMPEMNGAAVADAARAKWPHLPVVVASGYADTELVEKALGPSARILQKPYDVQQLQAVLDGLMSPQPSSSSAEAPLPPGSASAADR